MSYRFVETRGSQRGFQVCIDSLIVSTSFSRKYLRVGTHYKEECNGVARLQLASAQLGFLLCSPMISEDICATIEIKDSTDVAYYRWAASVRNAGRARSWTQSLWAYSF